MKFIKYKWFYFVFSLIILIPGIYSLIRYGLRFSIDFTGGTLLEIQTSGDLPKELTDTASSIQTTDDNTYLLRFKHLDKIQLGEGITQRRFEVVGPTIGTELTHKAILAVAVASVAIIIYIAWRFRSWKFGICAVVALLHDALVVLGIFSLLRVEIDALFVTAILTVIGFSVHDTIIVFDRIRENLSKMPGKTFEEVADTSISETLTRSINTSLTVVLTLLSLLIFGGQTIRWFVVALLIGIISGTYSSIFNAAPLLVMWEESKPHK